MNLNKEILKNYIQKLISIPSPSGYTQEAINFYKGELDKYKIPCRITNKGALVATIKGTDDEHQKTLSAHVDTLGAMVKSIKPSGAIKITSVGGFYMTSIISENCIIHTLSEKEYEGTIQSVKPSVHISGSEGREMKWSDEDSVEVIIDEKVSSKEDVENLGINVGDYISFDPRYTFTSKGFIKSRHLDDKLSAGVLLYALRYIAENNIKLPQTTNFFISNYEEVGHGASACVPEKTVEFVSVDMGAPGLDQNSSEYAVCIAAKDSSGPYDFSLRKKLISLCNENNIPYKIDIYPHYGSDASAALRAGWDIKTGLIGAGVFASHSYERTHISSVMATLELVLKYCASK